MKQRRVTHNFLRALFLIVILLTVSTDFSRAAISLTQQIKEKRVTVNIEKKSIVYILTEIQKQTKINFGFSEDLNHTSMGLFSVNAKDISVEEILKTLFADTKYKYTIADNKILIENIAAAPAVTQQQKPQKLTIKGKIIDEDKKPVVGATVIVHGTTSGAITDEKGEFSIQTIKDESLEVSFTGMKPQVIKVSSEQNLVITMKRSLMEVEDVVVTGYGAIKRSSFTGSSVMVKREDLLKASKTNVIQALQTFDPSFRIKENNQWGSDPNSLPEVYIRGESGIGVKELDKTDLTKSTLKDNPNLPTFIMDGFEISVTKLYDMDPNRIESVTILKDAAATALYGSRAANGVVVITTVTPKDGKLNVSYNFVGDVVAPDLRDYNLMNAREKLEVEKRAGCYGNWKDVPTELNYIKEYNDKLSNIERGVDTYWLSKPVKAVFNHKHSIYIDGGSENLRFGLDLQLTNQDGVMRGSKRDRYGMGFFIQYNYKTLQVRNNVSYQMTRSKESNYGSFSDYSRALPYNEYRDEEGKYLDRLKKWNPTVYYSNADLLNPLYESQLGNYDKGNIDELINNLSINWNIAPYLLLKGQLGITKTTRKSERFYDPRSMRNAVPLDYTTSSSGELYTNSGDALSLDMNAYLSFNRSIEKHNINAQAGLNLKQSGNSSISAQYNGFPSGSLHSSNYAREIVGKPSSSEDTNRLVGFLAALNYSYDNIYLLDASCRIDGSSTFGTNKKFAPFWSVGVGLNLHNYKFMEDLSFINLFKVRATYGQTGKVNFPAYAARTTYEVLSDEWFKTGYGVALKAMGNKNLTWETTNTIDAGFELEMFKNMFYVKFSYYEKKTIDLINDVTIPSGSGFTTYIDNIGEVSNKGYEIDLRLNLIRKKEVNLNVNANFAHNKNEILKIAESLKAYNREVQSYQENKAGGVKTAPFTQYIEGGSLNSIWGMKSMGINPSSGEEIFLLADGSPSDLWKASNQMVLGSNDPYAQGTFGVNFSYKQFGFYTSFMFEFGGQRYNSTLVNKVENVNPYTQNVDKRLLTDRWEKPGDNAKFKKLESGRTGVHQTQATSRFVQDYNMLSWNSLNVSYDLPEKILEKISLTMVRFEVGANDILHMSSVKQERGLQYPFARTINFSVKITI